MLEYYSCMLETTTFESTCDELSRVVCALRVFS